MLLLTSCKFPEYTTGRKVLFPMSTVKSGTLLLSTQLPDLLCNSENFSPVLHFGFITYRSNQKLIDVTNQ